MAQEIKDKCPYCGVTMRRWANHDGSSWSGPFQYVCFNDDCSYFVRGWDWMLKTYNVTGSYRHRSDPQTGEHGPLPVWSASDFRNGIIPEVEVEVKDEPNE